MYDPTPWTPSIVIFDFDGVFTDNRVFVFEDGREAVVCNRADSIGTNRLKQAGIPLLILSTETNSVVSRRAEKLGIPAISGCSNKKEFLTRYFTDNHIDARTAVYVGNDVNDAEAMKLVGYSVCPADAHPQIREQSTYCLGASGGKGAVRELCDKIIQGELLK